MNILKTFYLQTKKKAKKNNKKPSKNEGWSIKRSLVALSLTLILFFSIVPIVTYATYLPELGTKEEIMNRNNTGVLLYDRNGKVFFSLYQGKEKTFVPISQIPQYTQHAVITSEDKDFYSHSGFSLKAIARSIITDIKQRELAYGGSTITQQLVKNSLLTPEKSINRKVQEILLAQELERRYTKDEILEMYLNSAYFGEGAFGIENAANRYFNKHAKDLTLAESTILAALLPSPSAFSPISNPPDKAKERQKLILQKMFEQKYISKDLQLQAEAQTLNYKINDEGLNTDAYHFAMMVRDELIKKYRNEETISRSGFKVTTTLDLNWQKYAENAVANQVKNLAGSGASNGAAVIEDVSTGEIKALVGSKDWHDQAYGKVNVATSPRQPGSSFKPIIYAAALEEELITPATILQDRPTTFAVNYKPRNYDGKFRGPVTARRALSNSLNVPSVEVMSKVGVPKGVEMAKRLGITTLEDPSNYGLSMVLGAGEVKLEELTNAYATFANYGIKNDPVTILNIKDKYGRVVYTDDSQTKRVLEPEVAFLITSILSDTNSRKEVFGNVLDISRPAAVKTGTSESYRDSLTLGYTPSLAVGVWVGNNDGKPMNSVAGSLGAAPIWKQLMEEFLKGKPIEQFAKPEGVVEFSCQNAVFPLTKEEDKKVFSNENKDIKPSISTYKEYFIKGTEPKNGCSSLSIIKTDQLTPTPPSLTPTPSPQPEADQPMAGTPEPTQTPVITPTQPQITPPEIPQVTLPKTPNIPSITQINEGKRTRENSLYNNPFLTF